MAKVLRAAESRSWCFTDYELLDWKEIFQWENMRYVCWGRETCPKTGKVHYQGWFQLERKRRMKSLSKTFKSKQLFLTICKGTHAQNDTYCKKEGEYKSLGQYKTERQRTDLYDVHEAIMKGSTITEIQEEFPSQFYKYANNINKGIQLQETKRNRGKQRDIKVVLLTGPTGCGKTSFAMKQKDLFKKEGGSLKWFDGYDGEKCLLIDEYANQVPITQLLPLLDRYPLQLEVKGSMTWAKWDKVYITTNLRELHEQANPEHKKALARRITHTVSWWDLEKGQEPIEQFLDV